VAVDVPLELELGALRGTGGWVGLRGGGGCG
jgi:hypothetical protein